MKPEFGQVANFIDVIFFQDVPYKSVPLKEFKKHLLTTNSVPDIMRLFLDKPDLSDDQVNSIVYMKSHSMLHGKRDFHSRDVMNDNEIGGGSKSEVYFVYAGET